MAILRMARNVSNLERLAAFYTALGFRPRGSAQEDPALAALLGVTRVKTLRMTIGSCEIELTQTTPAGAPYPLLAEANTSLFQHIAVLTPDINTAAARAHSAGAFPISQGGPVGLPPASGNVVAWKFRDPDLHPIEFLKRQNETGYDHSGIVITNDAASVTFYSKYGLQPVHSQTNKGPEQDRLDGFTTSTPHITTLRAASGPGLELLNYGGTGHSHMLGPADIAADRLVVSGAGSFLLQDPDGHWVLGV
ncbi:MAG: VOC family protein [Rhodospirillales bacterium]|nr:VOC family protein [Rhodospirillales bacterium]